MNLTDLTPEERQDFQTKLDDMRRVIEGNPSYEGMKNVMANHAEELINLSIKYGIPPEITLSLCLIENGGGEDMKSPAGAESEMQVMPQLRNQKLEERGISIDEYNAMDRESQLKLLREFGVENLADMYNLFGDWGLSMWAYHGGQGNVYQALRVFFEDKTGANYGDMNNPYQGSEAATYDVYRNLMKYGNPDGTPSAGQNKDINMYNFLDILNNQKVKDEILSQLVDEDELYALKGIEANNLINEQMPQIIRQILDIQVSKALDNVLGTR